MALALSVLLSNSAWAKGVQLAGVHYQPEGIVIQVADGKMSAPHIETWPNIKDGVKTELILVRMPGCTGDYTSLQQAGSQDTLGHSEVKQFWIAPFSVDPKDEQGTQIVLEVETRPDAPEFTPQVLSQGNDQWVITLQTRPTRPNGPWSLEANNQPSLSPIMPEPQADADIQSVQTPQDKATSRANATQSGQSMLAALNQAKQRQAELGLQLIASQQALAESHAKEEVLQGRLNGYENILEAAGVDPKQDEHLESTAVIVNLRSALVKVAQKLKTAEDALAIKQSATSAAKTTPGKKVENLPAMAALSLAEEPTHKASPKQLIAQGLISGSKPGALGQPPLGSPAKMSAPMVAPTPTSQMKEGAKPTAKPNMNTMSNSGPAPGPTKEPTKEKKADPEIALKLALQKAPYSAEGYLNLADFYVAQKNWVNAKSTLKMLTQMKPDNAQGYYYLTMIYLHDKDKKNAQAALDQYAQKNPSDTPGIQKLKKAVQGNLAQSSPPKPLATAPTKGPAQQQPGPSTSIGNKGQSGGHK